MSGGVLPQDCMDCAAAGTLTTIWAARIKQHLRITRLRSLSTATLCRVAGSLIVIMVFLLFDLEVLHGTSADKVGSVTRSRPDRFRCDRAVVKFRKLVQGGSGR
jgi:hypothetical protein